MNEFLQHLKGKNVMVVGNAPVADDHSIDVNAADVVVRFNHFYNLESGKVGEKTDVVIQTFTSAWRAANNKHLDILEKYDATIFLGKKPKGYTPDIAKMLGKRKVVNLARLFAPFAPMTTGGVALCYIASALDQLEGTKIKVIGFGMEDEAIWRKYVETDAARYQPVADNERAAVKEAIAKIHAFSENQVVTPSFDTNDYRIVIPVKETSTGAEGKNYKLLPILLKKLTDACLGDKITVVSDSDGLVAFARCNFGIECVKVDKIDSRKVVTETLREWRDKTGYCGKVILAHCTSPTMKVEWITNVAEELKHCSLCATAFAMTEKLTALYFSNGGVYEQVGLNFGRTDKPRQELPKVIKMSGGVFGFHSDALDFPSFFDCGYMNPVIIREDALDVDTEEDLDKAIGLQ